MRSFGDRAALGFLSVLSSGAMLFLPWDRSSAQETLEQLERQIADRCRGKDPKFLIDARCREGSRFSAYEPNYAVWRRASGDENAIRVHYSFRHLLTAPDCVSAYRRGNANPDASAEQRKETAEAALECLDSYDSRYQIYLSFTGEFDFYLTTRASSPVINRVSSPGLHYRRHTPSSGWLQMKWWDVAVEHKSDGQATDARDRITDPASANFGQFRAQVEFDKGNHAFIDTISRGTNYVSGEARFLLGEKLDAWTRVKFFYFSNDTDVTWGPYANRAPKMAQFDVVRLVFARPFGRDAVSVEWTLGTKGLSTDSVNLGVDVPGTWRDITIPWFIWAHAGPLNTLSDYTRPQKAIGMGLKLSG